MVKVLLRYENERKYDFAGQKFKILQVLFKALLKSNSV